MDDDHIRRLIGDQQKLMADAARAFAEPMRLAQSEFDRLNKQAERWAQSSFGVDREALRRVLGLDALGQANTARRMMLQSVGSYDAMVEEAQRSFRALEQSTGLLSFRDQIADITRSWERELATLNPTFSDLARLVNDAASTLDLDALADGVSEPSATPEKWSPPAWMPVAPGTTKKEIAWAFILFFVLGPMMGILVELMAEKVKVRLGMSGCPEAADDAAPEESMSVFVVKADALRVRSGPSTTQAIITMLPRNAIVRAARFRAGWARVQYVDPSGEGTYVVGWVKRRYLSRLDIETQQLLIEALRARDASPRP